MIRLWTIVLFVGSFITNVTPQSDNSVFAMSDKSLNCHIVGKILDSSDPKFRDVLCENDKITVRSKVLVSCRYKSLTQWLDSGIYEINRLCPPNLEPQRKCLKKQSCFRTGTKLHLIGQTFATKEAKPRLEWGPISEAKGYFLLIQSSDGKEVYREKVSSSEFQFSKSLRSGELYQIDISVIDSRLSERFALYVLSQEDIDELNTILEIINSGNWSEIEKALYRDGAYTRFGLTLEALENLEKSLKIHQSRELQARLGNRYIDAGYFKKAQEIFDKLEQTSSEDDEDLQSQLPIKMKLPQ